MDHKYLIRAVAAGSCLVALLTACILETGGGEFVIINETSQPLYKGSNRLEPGGGRHILSVVDCSEAEVESYDEELALFARLDQYCEGQTWTINGPDEYTLEPKDD